MASEENRHVQIRKFANCKGLVSLKRVSAGQEAAREHRKNEYRRGRWSMSWGFQL